MIDITMWLNFIEKPNIKHQINYNFEFEIC